VAGYNIEYSGMKFAIFFAGEFMHVFTNGMLMAVLFTGGYHGPFVQQIPLLGLVWLIMKASVWYFISLWVRNSLPRLRIDQLMSFNWTVLVPLSIVNLLVMAFLLKVVQELGIAPAAADARSFAANLPQTLVFFLGNVAVFAGLMAIVRNQGRRERLAEEAEDEDEEAPLLPAETVAHASE
jgi:NADH-quinone oxidoreductase subunit H